MPPIPDDDRYRERWRALSLGDRRRILRAVNAGRALDDRGEAALAAVTARRQASFWQRIWLLGPVVALLFAGQGWIVYGANAALATAVLGAMSWWRLRRVRRARERNRAVAEGRTPRPRSSSDTNTGRGSDGSGGPSGHTPRRGARRPLPPDAKRVRPDAGRPKRSRRDRGS